MKINLPSLFLRGVFAAAMLCITGAFAQINYTQNFDDEATLDWTDTNNFEITDQAPCGGAGAFRANAYNYFGFLVQAGETMSPSLGTSSGMPITLQFQYQIVNYASEPPFTSVLNADDWGTVTIEYATSATGPWTTLQTIDPATYTESDGCQAMTINFTVLSGQQVYLRVRAMPNQADTDYYFYMDELSVTQPAAPACSGAPAASSAVSSVTTACTNVPVNLSLMPAYAAAGLTFQWQSSPDNVTYTNVAAGGDGQTYSSLQTTDTWYRALITCGGNTTTSTPVHVLSNGQLCYCEIDFSEAVEPISLVNIGTLNNASSATIDGTPAFEDFTSTVAPVSLVQGVSYPITIKGNTNGDWVDTVAVYIDFNHDGDYTDAGESFAAGDIENSTGADNVQVSTMIAVPANAMTGTTRMRVVKAYEDETPAPCNGEADFFFGQAEEYLVNITAPQACSTAPAAPVIAAADTTLCGTQGTTITMSTIYDQSGITLIWQSSPDGTTYTDITGANSSTYNVPSVTGTIWYRLVAICSNGNLSTPSQPVQITQTSPVCYCEITFSSDVEPITSVSFSTLTNTSSPEINGSDELEDFTNLDAPVVVPGQSYPITLMGNTGGATFTNYFTVFFDWNHDGTFTDAGEMFEIGTIMGSTGEDNISASANIPVPAAAELGYTQMRVVKRYNTSPTDPCGAYTYGQAEDYRLYVSTTAGAGEFNANTISHYPNPVKDILHITTATATVDAVIVYNLLGQEVLSQKGGAAAVNVDMASLAAGTYIVKASSGDAVKTIKVVKQ